MAITAVGTDGTVSPVAQGTAVTSNLPSGVTGADLMLMMVSFGSGATPTTINTPSGWTLLDNINGTSIETAIFYRFFVAGDSAPSFTLSTSRSWCSHSTAFRGVDTTNPFGSGGTDHSQQAQASSTTYVTPTLTPSEANAMVVSTFGGKVATGSTETITVASGWTSTGAINQSVTGTTDTWCGAFHYKLLGAASAQSETVTVGTAGIGVTGIMALNPAAGTTQVTLNDSGAGTDSAAVTVAAPLADTGAGSDTVAVTAQVPLAETAGGSDTIAVSAGVPLADIGSASDSFTVQQIVPKPLSDTGSATDSLTVTAAVPLADLGTAADTLAVAALFSLADQGSATDSFTVQIVGPGAPTPGTLTATDQALAQLISSATTATLTTDATPGSQLVGASTAVGTLTATSTPAGGPS